MVDYTQFVRPYKELEPSFDINTDVEARYLDAIHATQLYGVMAEQERRLNMKYNGKFIWGDDEYIVHDAEIVETPGCEGRLTARVSKKIHHNNTGKHRHLVIVANDKEQLEIFKTSVVCFFNKTKRERDDLEVFAAELIGIPMPTEGFNVVYFTTEDPQGRFPSDSKVIFLPRTTPKDVANFLLGKPLDIGPIGVTAATSMRVVSCSYMINRFCELDIEKIEVNTKKDTVAVFWLWNNFPEDSEFGTSDRVTVVKRKDGDPFNIFNAVAAAFCINKYKTRSHFRKVLRDKYGTEDIYDIVAMFELIEHFGSADKVQEIIEDRTEYLYSDGDEDTHVDISATMRRFADRMQEVFQGRK